MLVTLSYRSSELGQSVVNDFLSPTGCYIIKNGTKNKYYYNNEHFDNTVSCSNIKKCLQWNNNNSKHDSSMIDLTAMQSNNSTIRTNLKFGDIATIRKAYSDTESWSRVNGNGAIVLDVKKRVGAYVIEVVEAS